MHFPTNQEDLKQARRRFVYEEFLLFQLKMQALKENLKGKIQEGFRQNYDNEKVKNLSLTLPFPLTNAQKRVVDEILN